MYGSRSSEEGCTMKEEVKRRKEVTMQDIADLFGISKVTVSKAINNKDGIGKDLRQKILEKADELGYQFPKNASSRNGAIRNIVVFLDHKYFSEDISGYFYGKMYQLISRNLSEKGYGVTLSAIDEENHGSEVEVLQQHPHVVGAIVIGKLEEPFLERVRTINMPLIFVDYYDEESGAASVVSENIYSTYEITRHLINHGHVDIGFVGSIYVTPSILDRYLGYQRALLDHNLPVNQSWVVEDRTEHNEAIECTLPKTMPTAFVCNCDETAYRFMGTLQSKGYKVPEDISIVSFDNDIYSELCTPKLTTVAVDLGQIARMTAYRIDKQITNGVKREDTVTRVRGNIVYRNSVSKKTTNHVD